MSHTTLLCSKTVSDGLTTIELVVESYIVEHQLLWDKLMIICKPGSHTHSEKLLVGCLQMWQRM